MFVHYASWAFGDRNGRQATIFSKEKYDSFVAMSDINFRMKYKDSASESIWIVPGTITEND